MVAKRVAVIGAGPAGLVAAKHSVEDGHEVVVFEQTDQVGGIWVLSDDPKHHSAMYEGMKTNLPKEMMMYKNVPYDDDLPSFLTSFQVLDYLKKYSEGLPIKFNTKVLHVDEEDEKWRVTSQNDNSKETEIFDVVFVCNGHYVQPKIPFKTKMFKGKIIHSHDYRRASDFEGMRVAVIGTGPSGIDIALQLSTTAEEILFIGNRAVYSKLPKNIIQFSAHVSDMTDHTLILSDGNHLDGVEAVIICTGYNMDFPFLSKDLVQVVEDGQKVSPLWMHVVHRKHPESLFFIGLNLMVVTMTLFEHQVKLSLSLVSGRAKVPSEEEMVQWEKERMRFLEESGKPAHCFHSMTSEQWQYMDEMAEIGKFEKWNHHEVMAKMYMYLFEIRTQDVVNYKNVNFAIDGSDFRVVA